MEYRIVTERAWGYRHPKLGRKSLPPGTYCVPEELPESVASAAVDQGVAKKVIPAILAPKSDLEPVGPTSSIISDAPRRICERIEKRFDDICVVAASGPSLDQKTANLIEASGVPVIAVNDAHRLFPFAKMLYACDAAWWSYYNGVKDFAGERWSSHGDASLDDKRSAAAKYDLRLVRAVNERGFSLDSLKIHYGGNGGFQGVNVAIHSLGHRGKVLLVGFDMKQVMGRRHFFGEHPKELVSTKNGYKDWPPRFAAAAKMLPSDIEIINCTPGSALKCFRQMPLTEALP